MALRPKAKAKAKARPIVRPPVVKSNERYAIEGAIAAIAAQRRREPPPRAGEKKPPVNRKAVIARIRQDSGSSERDVEAALVRIYERMAAVGLVVKR